MSVGLCLLADRLVITIYGQSFAPTMVCMRILSWSVVLKFLHATLSMTLTSSNQQGLRVGIVASAALGNLLLNLLLIPRAGPAGASMATVLTDSWILVSCYVAVARQLGGPPIWAALRPPALSAMVMGLGVLLLQHISLVLLIPSAVVAYAVLLYALGGVPQEVVARLKALLPLPSWKRA
jgi:O-antigen/teichoic acid export membrane protein